MGSESRFRRRSGSTCDERRRFLFSTRVVSRGGPRLVDVAVPFLSTGTASIPLPPWGTLGLNPAQMMPLPPFVIPQPAGVKSVSFMVPNRPSLVGVKFYAQALLIQYPAAYLTNVTADVVLK